MSSIIGIKNSGQGIGDKIQFSSLPENYFLETGNKLVDIDRCWIYDHNPFVERDKPTTEVVDMWFRQVDLNIREDHGRITRKMLGTVDRICTAWDIPMRVRHPRLYKYEDEEQKKRVVVHTNGKSEGGSMTPEMISSIEKNYKGWEIVQIGGPKDMQTPFDSAKGLGLWETAQLIASSMIFIGVNSGMMNIAYCYPRVRKKIAVLQFEPARLENFVPAIHQHYTTWIDFNCELYNKHDRDYGATMSHKKI